VDKQAANDKRYFEVQPGSHELTVRYQFRSTQQHRPQRGRALVARLPAKLKFKDFNAGQRYQLQAGSIVSGLGQALRSTAKSDRQGTPAGCQRT
jgi:hypothetical protein